LTFGFALAAVVALLRVMIRAPSKATRSVVFGLMVSALATLAGFVLNRTIINSDNYRYLVTLLVPWSLGFGLVMDGLASRGRGGVFAASLAAVLLAAVMTADLSRWYARFGWVERGVVPIRRSLDDPILDWLNAHPEVKWIEGSYWDVYRLSYLTGGRVRGAPFAVFPNRFPDWRLPRDGNAATLVRRTPEGLTFRDFAVRDGQREVFRARGVTVLAWPEDQGR
jgi:hypothetical protein